MGVRNWWSLVSRLFFKAKPPVEPLEEADHTAGNLDRIFRKQHYSASHDRHYRIHLPAGFEPGKPCPLVMVLHGCRQTHLDIQKISNFDPLADKHGFIVVYPFVTHFFDIRINHCWGWWRRRQVQPGSGEVEDLWQIVEEIKRDYLIDPRRIHIAGLSSGGGMTSAALTVHPGRFASGAVVAGVAYRENPRAVMTLPFFHKHYYRPLDQVVDMMAVARDNDRSVTPLFIIHSQQDETVLIKAAERLRDSWLRYFSPGHKLVDHEQTGETLGVKWTHIRYGGRIGKSLVETLFLEGPGHGWYGGEQGEYSFPYAPDISAEIWDFFHKHPLLRREITESSGLMARLEKHLWAKP